jgi:hypothetical protein
MIARGSCSWVGLGAFVATAFAAASARAAEPENPGSGPIVHTFVAADTGSGPSVVPGLGLGLAWRVAHLSVGLDGAEFLASQGDLPDGPIVIHGSLSLVTVATRVCLSEPLRDVPVVADACAGLAVERVGGRLTYNNSAMVSSNEATAVLIAPLFDFAAEWWLSDRIALRASARFLAPIVNTNSDTSSWFPGQFGAAFSVEPSVGVSLRLWK